MNRFFLIDESRRGAEVAAWGLAPTLDGGTLASEAPDAHWVHTDDDGVAQGRCSLWWRDVPSCPGQRAGRRLGLIGHYAARDASAGSRVLRHACRSLAAAGCTTAVGPMNGSTWRDYRLITDFGDDPPFFLEPTAPPDWPAHFARGGFTPLASYFSAATSDLGAGEARLGRIANRLRRRGVQIRSLATDRFERDLRALHAVCTVAFRQNLFFKAIDEAAFRTQYAGLRRVIDADLVLIAEHQGRPVGIIATVPDLLQRARGGAVDTVVVKTLAVLPERAYAGLGQVLMAQVLARAGERGYRRAIHALVRDVGRLQRVSRRSAKPFRRYALLARELRS